MLNFIHFDSLERREPLLFSFVFRRLKFNLSCCAKGNFWLQEAWMHKRISGMAVARTLTFQIGKSFPVEKKDSVSTEILPRRYVEKSTRAQIPPLILSAESTKFAGARFDAAIPNKQSYTQRWDRHRRERVAFNALAVEGSRFDAALWNKFEARVDETLRLICVIWCFLHHGSYFLCSAPKSHFHPCLKTSKDVVWWFLEMII